MKKYVFFLLLSLLIQQVSLGNPIELLSPDSSIKVAVNLLDRIYYTVSANNQILFENSSLQLKLSGETLGVNPKLSGKKTSAIDETIQREIPLRNAQVKNNCNVLLLNFKGDYAVEFRAL